MNKTHYKSIKYLSSADYIRALMRTQGFKQHLDSNELSTALNLSESRPREQLIEHAELFFRERAIFVPAGLDSVPSAWLAQIPGLLWRTRKPHWDRLPYFIDEMKFDDGMLCLAFAQEALTHELGVRWDYLRVLLNFSLVPNIWRPMSSKIRDIQRKSLGLHRDSRGSCEFVQTREAA
ncbi:MAG: hypothetical protein U1G07_17800 [Verrucomicrobiota bacterium]